MHQIYQGDTQFFVIDANTGAQHSAGILHTVLVGETPRATNVPQTPLPSRTEIEALARKEAENFFPLHGGGAGPIESVSAELMRRGKAYKRVNLPLEPRPGKLGDSVWLVTVTGEYSFRPPPSSDENGNLGQYETRGYVRYWIYTMAGQVEKSASGPTITQWIPFEKVETPTR